MRTETITVRVGEDCGPIDWSHDLAKDRPQTWRDAEASPVDFTYGDYERPIIRVCMYDGWPYWRPMPAISYLGPLNCVEWAFFNSYGASIQPKRTT